MSRLSTWMDGHFVVISEHGYFELGPLSVDYPFELLDGVEYADFNGWILLTSGKTIQWDSRAMRERIRKYIRENVKW